MKLGISSYTYPWAIGLSDAKPSQPLQPLQLLEKARELGVGIVQFGPNMPLDQLPETELRDIVKRANSWKIDLEMGMVGIDPGAPAVPNTICQTHRRNTPENDPGAPRWANSDADRDYELPARRRG